MLQSLATDKADAGSSMLLNWLKPLEQGIDVTLTTGLHGCCTRLFVRFTDQKARRSASTRISSGLILSLKDLVTSDATPRAAAAETAPQRTCLSTRSR
jgi:hypothetical protein